MRVFRPFVRGLEQAEDLYPHPSPLRGPGEGASVLKRGAIQVIRARRSHWHRLHHSRSRTTIPSDDEQSPKDRPPPRPAARVARRPPPLPRALPGAEDASFPDPAPPKVATLEPRPADEPQPNADATFHAAPRPPARGAVAGDWASFLGPHHNNVCDETKLLSPLPKAGPAAGVGDEQRLGLQRARRPRRVGWCCFHRVEGDEVVDCLEADTGRRFWRFAYPSGYTDRYGYCDGPRASPVIAAGRRPRLHPGGRGNAALPGAVHRPAAVEARAAGGVRPQAELLRRRRHASGRRRQADRQRRRPPRALRGRVRPQDRQDALGRRPARSRPPGARATPRRSPPTW